MAPRLILFSGMGGDGRLMRPVRVDGVEVLTPDHVPPAPSERLPEYAGRVAELRGVRPADIVGGASFGGMLAAEISRQRPVAGLVLLGTTVHPSRLPRSYQWVEKMGRLVPDALLGLRTIGPLIRWRFAPLSPEAETTLVEMAGASSADELRAFGRMALDWCGLERFSCPVLSIHGERDRIIPPRCAEPGLVLKAAGHAFTLTHAAEVGSAIGAFLRENRLTTDEPR